jgi:type IV pilus assembly protein PilV
MLKPAQKFWSQESGFTLLEVLISLVVLMIGLLGMAGLIVNVQKADLDSYQRRQAIILLQDMVNRMNANRRVSACYAITNASAGTPYLGVDSTLTPTCTLGSSGEPERAISDLTDWDTALKGAAETNSSSSTNTGAMIGARGCISDLGSGYYRVSVAWQGTGNTFAPPPGVNCAINLYGDGDGDGAVDNLRRRVITSIVSIPDLTP